MTADELIAAEAAWERALTEAQRADDDLEAAQCAAKEADDEADAAHVILMRARDLYHPASLAELLRVLAADDDVCGCAMGGHLGEPAGCAVTNGHGLLTCWGEALPALRPNGHVLTPEKVATVNDKSRPLGDYTVTLAGLVALLEPAPTNDPRDIPMPVNVYLGEGLFDAAVLRRWVLWPMLATNAAGCVLRVYGERHHARVTHDGWEAVVMGLAREMNGAVVRRLE